MEHASLRGRRFSEHAALSFQLAHKNKSSENSPSGSGFLKDLFFFVTW